MSPLGARRARGPLDALLDPLLIRVDDGWSEEALEVEERSSLEHRGNLPRGGRAPCPASWGGAGAGAAGRRVGRSSLWRLVTLSRPHEVLALALLALVEARLAAAAGNTTGDVYASIVDGSEGRLATALARAGLVYLATALVAASAKLVEARAAVAWRGRVGAWVDRALCHRSAFARLGAGVGEGGGRGAGAAAKGTRGGPPGRPASTTAHPIADGATDPPGDTVAPALSSPAPSPGYPDSPDGRATQDLRLLSESLAGACRACAGLPLQMCIYASRSWGFVGPRGLAQALAFCLTASALAAAAARAAARAVEERERAEGALRSAHARLHADKREAATSCAGGDAEAELAELDARLAEVVARADRAAIRCSSVEATAKLADYGGLLTNYAIVGYAALCGVRGARAGAASATAGPALLLSTPGLAPPSDPGEVARYVSNASFAVLSFVGCITRAVDQAGRCAQAAGALKRVDGLLDALVAVRATGSEPRPGGDGKGDGDGSPVHLEGGGEERGEVACACPVSVSEGGDVPSAVLPAVPPGTFLYIPAGPTTPPSSASSLPPSSALPAGSVEPGSAAPLPPAAPVLQVRDLTIRTPDGARRLIASLSFDLPEGTDLALVGPSGAGKSSLLTALAGLARDGGGDRSHEGRSGPGPEAKPRAGNGDPEYGRSPVGVSLGPAARPSSSPPGSGLAALPGSSPSTDLATSPGTSLDINPTDPPPAQLLPAALCDPHPLPQATGLVAWTASASFFPQRAVVVPAGQLVAQIAYPHLASGTADEREAARRAASLVGLEDRPPAAWLALSPGERTRLGVARALASDARVHVLDEPDAGVGSMQGERLLRLVFDGPAASRVVSSHRLEDVRRAQGGSRPLLVLHIGLGVEGDGWRIDAPPESPGPAGGS